MNWAFIFGAGVFVGATLSAAIVAVAIWALSRPPRCSRCGAALDLANLADRCRACRLDENLGGTNRDLAASAVRTRVF